MPSGYSGERNLLLGRTSGPFDVSLGTATGKFVNGDVQCAYKLHRFLSIKGITVWRYKVPADVAVSLRRRCLGPATLESLPIETLDIRSVQKQQGPTNVKPQSTGCSLGGISYGPESAEFSVALEEDQLQLMRSL
jgi:hypothetical protein